MLRRYYLIALISLSLTGCSPTPKQNPSAGSRKPPVPRVILSEVQTQALSIPFQRPGFIKYRRVARLFNQEEGRIIQVGAYAGDQVDKDQILITMDGKLLEAEINKAQANRSRAKQKLHRIMRLMQSKSASEEALLEAQTELKLADAELNILKIRHGYTRIRAPFSALITERRVEPGDIMPRSSHLLTLIDPDSAVIQVNLGEKKLLQTEKEQKVEVLFDYPRYTRIAGHISRLYPRLDPETHLGTVEISLDATPQRIFEGQRVTVFFNTPAKATLIIPFRALRRDRQGEFVFRFEQHKVLRTPVRSGAAIGQQIAILEGLKRGQLVVSKGFMGLADGTAVKPIEKPRHHALSTALDSME